MNVARISVAQPTAKHRPALTYATVQQRRPPLSVCRGLGKDVVDGYLDIAKFVGGSTANKSAYGELASNIGREVYIDVAGWHLYLKDVTVAPNVKMHDALANQIGPQARDMREADIESLLKKIPIKLGAGKTKVSLYEVMPSMCVADLVRAVEDFARKR